MMVARARSPVDKSVATGYTGLQQRTGVNGCSIRGRRQSAWQAMTAPIANAWPSGSDKNADRPSQKQRPARRTFAGLRTGDFSAA
jgi:hypothetical protein